MKMAIMLSGTSMSGGVYVVLQHASYLVDRGHDVIILSKKVLPLAELSWHPDSCRLKTMTIKEAEDDHFDVIIATFWVTVYWLHRIQAKAYVYFNQSVESRFYFEEQKFERGLAEATYLSGAFLFTEATWIKEYVHERYGIGAWLVRNGIRKDVYSSDGPAIQQREQGKLRILVEGPLGVSFKNVERTIELCQRSSADEVWLLTSSEVADDLNVDRVFSRVPVVETPAIYRSCDVLVKLSYIEGMFGPPLEMFHCGGTAIVYDVSGHDEYIVNGKNAIVVPTDDEDAVICAINRLKSDNNELDCLKAGAVHTATQWHCWSESSAEFEKGLRHIMADEYLMPTTVFRQRMKIMAEIFMNYQNTCISLHEMAMKNGEATAHVQSVQNQLNEVMNSLAWKIGRAITWLPRRLLQF